ncbi:MAG: hypothetical protein LBB58_03685 [Cellulomonadaceae bacterium]|jgi:cytochrome c oxidase subunit 4|nr:hypothetical protein [Cellulomonadaceae bacterium]
MFNLSIGYGWLNLAALALGIIAWIIPIIILASKRDTLFARHGHGIWGVSIMISLGACALALFLQILYQNYLVTIQDWAALMDTTGAVVIVSGVLLLVTLALNIAVIIRHLTHTRKNRAALP